MGATSIWKNRSFIFFFSGQLISKLGDGIYTLALVWMMHVLTNSAILLSLTLAVGVIPRIFFGPVIGVFVDRWPKRTTLIVTDLVRAGLLIPFSILTFLHHTPPWLVLLLSFVLATAATLFSPAYVVAQKAVVTGDALLQANALRQVSTNISQIAGPSLAGFIIGFCGLGSAYAVDAGTFLVSAASLLFVHFQEPPRVSGKVTVMRDIRQGARILVDIPLLRALTPVMLVYNFFACGLENLLIVQFVSNVLHLGVVAVGAMSTCIAVGELVSGLAMSLLNRFVKDQRVFVLCMLVASFAFFWIDFTRSIYVMGGLLFVAGFCITIINVLFFTNIQLMVPSDALGRVSVLLLSVFDSVTPLSQMFFGAMAALLPAGFLISGIGACGMLTGFAAFLFPSIRRGGAVAAEVAAAGQELSADAST
ncbi:MAG: MFS transporter [Alicyclobacillus sp.]|nr:MFS transporter [Alicyclobacillus sp.]